MIETQNLSVQEVQALFFDKKALKEPTKKLYRLNNHSGGRYYYSFDAKGVPQFYISVTNLIRATMPTPTALIKWIADKTYDEAEAYKEERAGYGTFMHGQFEKLLIERVLDLDKMDAELLEYCAKNHFNNTQYSEWLHELKRDVLGFAQFLIDFNVKPLAIEIVLASDKNGYAGALDLVAELTLEEKGFFGEFLKSGPNKGQPKETKRWRTITAIIDFKSGRKGFYEEHEIQLEAYKQMLEENFPEIKVDKLFNYGPSEWRSSPGYKLKDQTDSSNRAKLQHLCQIARIEAAKREKHITTLSGVIDIRSTEADLSKNITQHTLEEYVNKRTAKIKSSKNETKRASKKAK